jgi:hypothetical protein
VHIGRLHLSHGPRTWFLREAAAVENPKSMSSLMSADVAPGPGGFWFSHAEARILPPQQVPPPAAYFEPINWRPLRLPAANRVPRRRIGRVARSCAVEVILKPLEGMLAMIAGYAGTALLGDGRVLLVLDLKELI